MSDYQIKVFSKIFKIVSTNIHRSLWPLIRKNFLSSILGSIIKLFNPDRHLLQLCIIYDMENDPAQLFKALLT